MTARPDTIPSACRRLITRWRGAPEAGSVAIEFAVILPVFILMIFGAFELSHYSYARLAVSDAARDGTRYAMVRGATSGAPASSSAIRDYVRGRVALLDSSQVTVTTSFTPDNQPGSIVQVAVSYPFTPLLPGLGYITARTLTSSAQMTIAQ